MYDSAHTSWQLAVGVRKTMRERWGESRSVSLRWKILWKEMYIPLRIARANTYGETMARRTNYGFEKKQRELRKQKKKQEKAERRNREEAASSAPEGGETADETPSESEQSDGSRE